MFIPCTPKVDAAARQMKKTITLEKSIPKIVSILKSRKSRELVFGTPRPIVLILLLVFNLSNLKHRRLDMG